jgi:chromosome segregation ATPase
MIFYNVIKKINSFFFYFKSDNLIKTLQRDVALLDKEKSEMRSQLIEAEQNIERLKYNTKANFEHELETYRKKYIEYELKFNDKQSESHRLQSELDHKSKRLAERESALSVLETKLAEMNDKIHRLNADCKESSNEQIELQRKLCSVLVEKEAVMKSEQLKKLCKIIH